MGSFSRMTRLARVATRIALAQLDGSEWQLALGLLSWMDVNVCAWQPAVGLLS